MKALFFPFSTGPGLAHAGACLSVAGRLVERDSEAFIAYGGTRPDLVRGDGIGVIDVEEVPLEAADNHQRVDPFYPDVETLIRFIEGDRAVIESEAPDVVVVDMRMPSMAAAELAGIPTVAINHFLPFTGYTTLSSWQRRLRMLRHPLRVASRLPSIFRRDPFGAQILVDRFAEARRVLGLPPMEGLPMTGPCTAFTTTPFLDPPSRPLPQGWHYAGPITWSVPGGQGPPGRGSRPLVFISQGTLGSGRAMKEIVKGLSGLEAEIAVVTMGVTDREEIESLGPGITALEVVDNDAWVSAADVAVMHGGHLSMSAAARAGTPTVVIPDGRDHWAWAAKTDRLGTGIALYRPLIPGAVGRAVRKILTDPGYTERADRLARKLEGWSGEEKTADLIERVAAEPELGICGSPGS
jgi:UDP:flavonoid glycosyltransferase YjiC (YdhE family)